MVKRFASLPPWTVELADAELQFMKIGGGCEMRCIAPSSVVEGDVGSNSDDALCARAEVGDQGRRVCKVCTRPCHGSSDASGALWCFPGRLLLIVSFFSHLLVFGLSDSEPA